MIKIPLFLFTFFISCFCFADKNKSKDFEFQNHAISFTENKGQVSDQNYKPRPDVLFGGTANGMNFHLRNNGVSYQLNRVDSWKERNHPSPALPKGERVEQISDKTTIYRLDINWLNCNSFASLKKGEALPGYNNYYLEVCPNGVHNVLSYKEITYQNIYSGIDLKWYEKDGNLKYDYIIAAGADYKQIQLEIKGAEKISLNSKGELIMKTPLGDIIEKAPLVNQNGKTLRSNWLIKNNVISFEIEDLDPNEAFVIDPAVCVRNWGTYYGSAGTDQGQSNAKDINGNVFLGGTTSSNASIATVGSHQLSFAGGLCDAFISKFNSAGVRQWSTYYGGAGEENGPSCAADASGNVYITGFTNTGTGNIIATPGSHQPAFGSGGYDAYLVKFNSSGVRQWGTYYGGALDDYGTACSTDASGNVYLAGYTGSNTGTVIATAGSHQTTLGGSYDAFLVQFNTNGLRQWATYYGGNGNDYAFYISEAGGNVFLTGYTDTNVGTSIATPGSHQPANGGIYDAYLVKFNSSGVRQWGTYYGSNGDDEGYSCTADAAGYSYIAGFTSTNSGTAIASDGSHQSIYGGGGYDAFLVKFNPSGLRQWGTYYGGSGDDLGYCCTAGAVGKVYLAGYSGSNTGTVIATPGSHQSIFGGGSNDAFLVQFDTAGVREWGTYYGGGTTDVGYACSTNLNGIVYLVGNTNSGVGTVVATNGSHQTSFGGGLNDAFIVQFYDCNLPAEPTNTTPVPNQTVCENSTTTLSATGSGTINWFATPTSTTILGTGNTFITPVLSAGTYTYYAEAFTCAGSAIRTAITISVSVCNGIKQFSNSKNELKVYPNPNSGSFTISSGVDLNLNLVNELGQLIKIIKLNASNNYQISIEDLRSGVYFIYGTNGSYVVSDKIVVVD